MRNEQEIKQEWNDSEEKWLVSLSEHLRKHEYNAMDILSQSAADLCNVTEKAMFTSQNEKCTQAKKLFWYAYQYMTQATFVEIAQKTATHGVTYTAQSVAKGIRSMQERIQNDELWARRWAIIRTIIRFGKEVITEECERKDVVLSLKIPKELRNKIKIEVKQ